MTFGVGEAIAVVELAITAREQGWFDKLLSVFKKKQRVLVLGETGVGKSQLLEMLSGSLHSVIDLMERTEFVEQKQIKIKNTPFIFIDTPGQKQFDDVPKQALQEELRKKSFGVINIVAYGYHESKAVRYQKMVTKKSVNVQFLERQRQLEISQLDEWARQLDPSKVSWILTVISKADLWWDERQTVVDHYLSGDYAKELARITDIPHYVTENSSCSKKFYGVAPMSGYFEDSDQIRLRANLLKMMLRLASEG